MASRNPKKSKKKNGVVPVSSLIHGHQNNDAQSIQAQ